MHSMTGFGSGSASSTDLSATIELSSINRKQADIQITLPRSLAALEIPLRKKVAAGISRGRVQGTVSLEALGSSSDAVTIDLDYVRSLKDALAETSEALRQTFELSTTDILSDPRAVQQTKSDWQPEPCEAVLSEALEKALTALLASRASEGAAMEADLLERISILEQNLAQLTALSPEVLETYRNHLLSRLEHIGLDIDLGDERILREIALFAEKTDISEELTRLKAHFESFRSLADSDEPCGRPLDFLCQEINREFNTIGSKAHHAGIAAIVVDSKTELEKIREQVQNVE